jgi:hypothetical protein
MIIVRKNVDFSNLGGINTALPPSKYFLWSGKH